MGSFIGWFEWISNVKKIHSFFLTFFINQNFIVFFDIVFRLTTWRWCCSSPVDSPPTPGTSSSTTLPTSAPTASRGWSSRSIGPLSSTRARTPSTSISFKRDRTRWMLLVGNGMLIKFQFCFVNGKLVSVAWKISALRIFEVNGLMLFAIMSSTENSHNKKAFQ